MPRRKPPTDKLTKDSKLRTTEKMHAQLAEHALAREWDVPHFIRHVLALYLAEHPRP